MNEEGSDELTRSTDICRRIREIPYTVLVEKSHGKRPSGIVGRKILMKPIF
jgi:hypothetical protein